MIFRISGTESEYVHKAYAEKILVSEHPSCILILKEIERLIYKAFKSSTWSMRDGVLLARRNWNSFVRTAYSSNR